MNTMDPQGIKQVIKYIEYNCSTTITPKQMDQLREMRRMGEYNIYKLRTLYRIAIDNSVYPECPRCKKPIVRQGDLSIDHIVPKACGGTDDIENLQPMHRDCNCAKGSKMPEITTCPIIPIKKHRKNHNETKHKKREIVKSRTPEELYKKCQKIDQARANRLRVGAVHGYSK